MSRPLAIEVTDVRKSFPVPGERSHHSLRERLLHPLRWREQRVLEVLREISFDVRQGEFFGIVGRNGSGKSTLLKLLASVYRADAGRIRIAGRLAPFLELGVGFNPQLPAYENVVLNAVMMGLTPEQARRRFDAVIDFAGLEDFVDMPLKNYSSGMKVRLAFAVMTQVNADVMLLDEVLAVGDTEFQQKCENEFQRLRASGRTIVLVTHSMPTINAYCDRAMLLHDGEIAALGAPVEISNRYLEVNMRAAAERGEGAVQGYAERFADVIADPPVRIVDAWLADPAGRRTEKVATGDPIELHALVEVEREIERPGFQFRVDDTQGQALFSGGAPDVGLEGERARPGERLRVRVRVDNRLAAGRYVLLGAVARRMPDGGSEPATPITSLNFEVTGEQADGIVFLDHEVTMERVPRDEMALR